MEVGQANNIRLGFIVQSRMKSERLPEKVLLNLPLHENKNAIKWIVDQLNKSIFRNSKTIIATSKDKTNDVLRNYCKKINVECFSGDENDVLSRFITIINNNNFDAIVRLTGDNPLIDTEILDKTIEKHFSEKNHYTKTLDLPLGMNFEIINPKTLVSIGKKKLTDVEKEHVTLFLKNNNEKYKCGYYSFGVNPELSKLRLSIDYPSDFVVVASVLSLLGEKNISIKKISEIYENYPWLFDINIKNLQKNT